MATSKQSFMRISRRDMLKLTGAAAAGGLLAACAPPPTAEVIKETVEVPVQQTVVVSATEAPLPTEAPLLSGPIEGHVVCMHFLHEFTEDHVAAFQAENPSITLEVIQADPTRFFAMYAAGSPPDLLRCQAPAVPQYLARKMLFDLTPFFEVSESLRLDDLAPANNYYKAYSPLEIGDGPIYGMCKDFSPDCTIFVYKPLFEGGGLAVPDDTKALTYDEIYQAASTLSKFEGDRTLVFGYDYEHGWVDRFMMNILAETGGTIFSEDLTKLVIKDNEATYAVAKWFYDLSANKLTDSIINPSPGGWFGTDFNQAIVAMAQYGFWYGAMAETDVNRGGVITLPGPTWTGTRRDPTVTATGMIMASATKVPEAAWKVFEFYNAGQPAVERAGSGWGVPALMSMYELMPNNTEYEQQKLRVLQGELALETPPLQFNPFLGETTVADSWNAQVNRALQGEITFDEAVANVESEINTAIEDGIQRIL
ncbi:MAG TPA: ABC transporter substrate-binding protein [Anaerolineae bacterium]|nr:ABC transporter substrate-binding protein [Anaerolineae bacterium]